jgi:hypothetical protein
MIDVSFLEDPDATSEPGSDVKDASEKGKGSKGLSAGKYLKDYLDS